jgi:uncharacterized protein (DUF2235 family)
MPKRLILCCDGTWNKLEDSSPTNINRLAQSIPAFGQDGMDQKVWYQSGIGTNWYDRLPGGAFGLGIDSKIQEAYEYLCNTYEAGDEIYLFGFSRGAYTARSLGGLIHCSGLVLRGNDRQFDRAYRIYRERNEDKRHRLGAEFQKANNSQRVPITLMACWDTVGSLGIPDLIPNLPIDYWLNLPYRFHNTNLSELIQNALHAVALDEQRKVFSMTPMYTRPNAPTKLRQVWFVGNHESIGSTFGGIFADISLDWMLGAIAELGLGLTVKSGIFDPAKVAPDQVLQNIPENKLRDFVENAKQNFLSGLGLAPREIEGTPNPENLTQLFHSTILKLWCRQPGYPYRPPSLDKTDWQEVLNRHCTQ